MPVDKTKTLTELVEDLKTRFEENNLTFKEISLNTNVPEQLLQIIFSNQNNVISDLSNLFVFAKTSLRSQEKKFYVYRFFDNGNQIKITRVIEPKASIYYDRSTQNYYRFSFRRKTSEENAEVNKDLIINEMADNLEIYINSKE